MSASACLCVWGGVRAGGGGGGGAGITDQNTGADGIPHIDR